MLSRGDFRGFAFPPSSPQPPPPHVIPATHPRHPFHTTQIPAYAGMTGGGGRREWGNAKAQGRNERQAGMTGEGEIPALRLRFLGNAGNERRGALQQ